MLCDTHDAEALREFNYPPERMQSETALGAESEPADMADDMMDEEPPERSQSPVISDLRTAEANVLTRKLPLILRQLQDGEVWFAASHMPVHACHYLNLRYCRHMSDGCVQKHEKMCKIHSKSNNVRHNYRHERT